MSYDTLQPINLVHENFNANHNGVLFQTKDLDTCNLVNYVIFNGAVYQSTDDHLNLLESAEKIDFTGTVHFYSDVQRHHIEEWISYDLILDAGEIIDVVAHEPQIMKNSYDKASLCPADPDNRVQVTIGVGTCDDKKVMAMIDLLTDDKLDEIRSLLESPTATIYFPRMIEDTLSPSGHKVCQSASIVQTLNDFDINTNAKQLRSTMPDGNKLVIALDEMHSIFQE